MLGRLKELESQAEHPEDALEGNSDLDKLLSGVAAAAARIAETLQELSSEEEAAHQEDETVSE